MERSKHRPDTTNRATGPDQGKGEHRRYSLPELTRAAGVSTRTIRYYMGEGLLPPPTGAGPGSHYSDAHLDRLRLIGQLKAEYLPLREIRRRLDGLSDQEVRDLLAHPVAPPERDSAVDYVGRLLRSRPARAMPDPTPARVELHETILPSAALDAALSDSESPPPSPMLGRVYPAASLDLPPESETGADEAAAADPGSWRRVPLGDDAELLIRESAYRRRRDRVEWLIAWARRVFG
jgi:DNA-binding transcriptional MerR regulator